MSNWQTFHDRLIEVSGALADRVSDLVAVVLDNALEHRASDVHFEPTHSALVVRFRIDGVLQTVATLPKVIAPNVSARLKVLAELLTYRLDIPQEGRMRPADCGGVDMRVSTFPTIHGEKVVVRIFDPSYRTFDLDELGLPPAILEWLKELLLETSGAVLLTGPSGSGKTTTVYACLAHLVRQTAGRRHVVTVEDPVEYAIEGVSQSQVRPGSEFDFARSLRSILRQGPEVIMIGEIRDRETAQIAVEAALTGHLIFSTLHTGSACACVSRLLEMEIEPHLLASSLRAIVNQRLVRRLCPVCGGRRESSRPAPPNDCPACMGTGYQGRVVLAELLVLDQRLRSAILRRADTAGLQQAADAGGRPMLRDEARRAVEAGLTDREEVRRVLGGTAEG